MGIFVSLLLVYSLSAQPTVDGDLSDPEYMNIASGSGNSGFGPAVDVTGIYYYSDNVNNQLYLGVTGVLPTTGSSDGIGLWFNISGTGSPSGAASGTGLGIGGTLHYIDGDGSQYQNFAADFEVDFMFALNTGGGAAEVFLDGGTHVGAASSSYLGPCDQMGTPASISNPFGLGGSGTFAFDNGGGGAKGFEVALDYSAVGATQDMCVEAFAFVVSSTAFFSDVTAPGFISTGNPGWDPNFTIISGGPFHTDCETLLPVEWDEFTARPQQEGVALFWRTATETNNDYFIVERSTDGRIFQELGRVSGAGSTEEPQEYRYWDERPAPGVNYYRLRQMDYDGTFDFSPVRSVWVEMPGEEALVLYPMPVRDQLRLYSRLPFPAGQQAELFDLRGRRLLSLPLPAEATVFQLDLSELPAGPYFLRMGAEVKRVLKQ